ncbi:hypothetical protein CAEBREN_14411 [Caenorhabditis brenneri]|uniref:Uncharacterized protein n=1 Tax=Caenorhabditis brenneri TaxID=135651 RepID=G0NQP3_CAEBE|nr:hypothetical protein CAEBREN_14411 [Caenorhabditis brenneri]
MSNRAAMAGSSSARPPLVHLSDDDDDDIIEISPTIEARNSKNNNLRDELHAARNLNTKKDAIIAIKDTEIQRLMAMNSNNFDTQNGRSSYIAQELKEALQALKQKDDLLETQEEKLQAAILKRSQAETLAAENESLKKKLQKSEEAKNYFEDRSKKWEDSYHADTGILQKLNTNLLETQKSHHNEKVEWEEEMNAMIKDNEKLQRKVDKYKKKSKKRSRKERKRGMSYEDAQVDIDALKEENGELKIDVTVLESQQVTLQAEKMELKTENTRLNVENVLLNTQNPRLQEENSYVKNVNKNLMEDLRKVEDENKILKAGQERKDSRKSTTDRYEGSGQSPSSSKRSHNDHDSHRDRHRSDSRRDRDYTDSRSNSFAASHWESCKRRRPDYQRH